MNQKRPFIALGVVGIVIVAGFAYSAGTPGYAHASFLGDLWGQLSAPVQKLFGIPAATPSGANVSSTASSSADLYQPALDYERAVTESVKKAMPAVVAITISKNVPVMEQCPSDPFGNLGPGFQDFFGGGFQFYGQCQNGTKLQEVGGGSGFIISADGLILTNKHVVSDEKAEYTVVLNDGTKYDATVLARDPAQDLAVVRIDANDLPTVVLGDSDAIELGQTAIAIGNALSEFRNTVSVGVVSGLARTVTASGGAGLTETIPDVIQTDAAINPGNSGGPLLNLRGQVIGIDTAVATDAQNIGFAIPVNDAKRDIASVKATGAIEVPYLGVRYLTITPDLVKQEKLSLDQGALVRGSQDGPAIVPDSPAAKAGLQAEDIVTAVNGTALDATNTLGHAISRLGVGDTATLTVRRGDQTLTLTVTLEKRPESL